MHARVVDDVLDAPGEPLPRSALKHVKAAWTTRRVPLLHAASLVDAAQPRAGDLVLARVERLGQHGGLQLVNGRRATLFERDLIVACYGDRYAPDQFEAEVPRELGPCELVAAGGIVGRVRRAHAKMRAATRLLPLGLLADCDGAVLNVERYPLDAPTSPSRPVPVIAVVGTSMNAGKTSCAAHLIRGLSAAGLEVGAAKLTGTGACGDSLLMRDAGAVEVLDFVDAGLATTYRASPALVERAAHLLLDTLAARNVDVVVVEIADGLLQPETAALLQADRFARRLRGTIFTSPDAMGAVAGVEWLERRGIAVLALSGVMTAAPLAAREAAAATRLPVYDRAQLAEGAHALALFRAATERDPLVAGCAR